MCDGGVRICMRSADGQLQRVTPVPDGHGERSVGVTHRLRHAGGARAEHEQRVRFRAGRLERTRSRGVIGSSRCSIGISSASTGWSPTAWVGLVSASACSTSPRFQAGLSSTAAAPSRQIARSATTNSGRFDDISATRSPARTPRCSSVVAIPLASASSCDRVYCALVEGERARLTHATSPRTGARSFRVAGWY